MILPCFSCNSASYLKMGILLILVLESRTIFLDFSKCEDKQQPSSSFLVAFQRASKVDY